MEKESLELLLGQGFSVAQIGARFGKDMTSARITPPADVRGLSSTKRKTKAD